MADKELKYTDFEELVFEDRNREYGAYDLRKSYRWFLTTYSGGNASFLLQGTIAYS